MYVSYPNGSILILSQQKIYTNESYTRKGDNAVLCTNFTTNYTRSVSNSGAGPRASSVASIFELVGSSISITTSLMFTVDTSVIQRVAHTERKEHYEPLFLACCLPHCVFNFQSDRCIITPRKIEKLYFKINKIVFKTANVFDLIDHHQVMI